MYFYFQLKIFKRIKLFFWGVCGILRFQSIPLQGERIEQDARKRNQRSNYGTSKNRQESKRVAENI